MSVSPAITSEMRRWKADSAYFVRKHFKVEPDPGQLQLLAYWDDPANQRIGMKSSKGTAKTAGLAWCAWHFLATRLHPNIAAIAISMDNLRDNLWKEMAVWQNKSPYLTAKYKWMKTRIVSMEFPETWWMSARSWSRTADAQQQNLSLAGLHKGNTAVFMDESGGIPDAVSTTGEGTLATVGGEHRIVQAGNPTHLEGPLYRACTNERHLWKMIEMTGDPDDPRRSPRVSITWAREQIEKYGRDNPWVLVNVFGQFPPSSLNTLLGPDQVSAAMQTQLHETMYSHEAKILGVDAGRFGGARSVIFPRQGLAAFPPVILRPDRSEKNWTGVFAGRIAQAIEKFQADMVFIDDTGGWGSGVLDALMAGGYPVCGVTFGGTALDARRYRNRRCEMHFLAAEWVKKGGSLPYLPELQREATATTYTYQGGKFVLEEKEQVQEKLGESPDLWDAFCLTFAAPVIPKTGLPWMDARTMRAKTYLDEPRDYATVMRAVVDE